MVTYFEKKSENGKLNVRIGSSEENSAEAVAPFFFETPKIFQDMLIACLGKNRDEPTTFRTLLLGTVMLSYSTL